MAMTPAERAANQAAHPSWLAARAAGQGPQVGDNLTAALQAAIPGWQARQASAQARMANAGPWARRYASQVRGAYDPTRMSGAPTDPGSSGAWTPPPPWTGPAAPPPPVSAPVPSATDQQFQAGQGYVDTYRAYLANPNDPAAQSAAYQGYQNARAWGVPGVPPQFPSQPTGLGSPTDRQVAAGQGYVDTSGAYFANPSVESWAAAQKGYQNAQAWGVPGVVNPQANQLFGPNNTSPYDMSQMLYASGSGGQNQDAGPPATSAGGASQYALDPNQSLALRNYQQNPTDYYAWLHARNLLGTVIPETFPGGPIPNADQYRGAEAQNNAAALTPIQNLAQQNYQADPNNYYAWLHAQNVGVPGLAAFSGTQPTAGQDPQAYLGQHSIYGTAGPANLSGGQNPNAGPGSDVGVLSNPTYGGGFGGTGGGFGGGFRRGGLVEPLAERLRRAMAARGR